MQSSLRLMGYEEDDTCHMRKGRTHACHMRRIHARHMRRRIDAVIAASHVV